MDQSTASTTALEAAPARQGQLSIFASSPLETVRFATELANALSPIIEKQGMFSMISGRKYPKVEAWLTLGAMLGILPREASIKELPDGSYEAYVDLVSRDGTIVGGASAICGVEEARWAKADRYARRSMAVTRATGKAYRISFSWIVGLAGYEVTPAEEMPYDGAHPQLIAHYNHQSADDRAWIKAELEKAEVPEDGWRQFGVRYNGKAMDAMTFKAELAAWMKRQGQGAPHAQ